MTMPADYQVDDLKQEARTHARAASDAFLASAGQYRTAPGQVWNGPTGCAKWDLRALAGHVVGEAVWFANLANGVLSAEPSLGLDAYSELKVLSAAEMAGRSESAARAIRDAIESATRDQLQETVDMGWTEMPLWRATAISCQEAVLHEWDGRAGQDPGATIPPGWAKLLVVPLTRIAPFIARRDAVEETPATTYLMEVADGVGPITVHVSDARVTLTPGDCASPEVALQLTANQFVRLLAGRFDLATVDVPLEGDRNRAPALNRIFAGIAGDD